uniref:Uncharacterized protein n=1 Tax=Arcella intermedia TaxID=1963864 RepID=A0A6B2LSP3_9EUKA
MTESANAQTPPSTSANASHGYTAERRRTPRPAQPSASSGARSPAPTETTESSDAASDATCPPLPLEPTLES